MIFISKIFLFFVIFLLEISTSIGSVVSKLNQDSVDKIALENFQEYVLESENKLYTNNINEIDNLINIINKITKFQSEIFQEISKPYNIWLTHDPYKPLVGETRSSNIIIEGNLKNTTETMRVLAHELFHRYLGHIIVQNKKDEVRHKWFFEGFTEYYGLKTLMKTKLIKEEKYLYFINKTLENYFTSRVININLDKITKKHLLDYNIRNLIYDKGFLVALIIDENILTSNSKKKNIDDFLRCIKDRISSDFNIKIFKDCLNQFVYEEKFSDKILLSLVNSDILKGLLPHIISNKYRIYSKLGIAFEEEFDIARSLENLSIQNIKKNSTILSDRIHNGLKFRCYGIDQEGNTKLKLENNKIIQFKNKKRKVKIPVYKKL